MIEHQQTTHGWLIFLGPTRCVFAEGAGLGIAGG